MNLGTPLPSTTHSGAQLTFTPGTPVVGMLGIVCHVCRSMLHARPTKFW